MKVEVHQKKRNLIMLIPAFWAALFDITITIIYQPKEYWKGNLKIANEANPIGAFAMQNHVSGIFIISSLWLILIGLIGIFLTKKQVPYFSLFVMLCHTWGGSSWVMNHFVFPFVMLYIAINTTLFLKIQEKIEKCQ